jgi:hypothetical protein
MTTLPIGRAWPKFTSIQIQAFKSELILFGAIAASKAEGQRPAIPWNGRQGARRSHKLAPPVF